METQRRRSDLAEPWKSGFQDSDAQRKGAAGWREAGVEGRLPWEGRAVGRRQAVGRQAVGRQDPTDAADRRVLEWADWSGWRRIPAGRGERERGFMRPGASGAGLHAVLRKVP